MKHAMADKGIGNFVRPSPLDINVFESLYKLNGSWKKIGKNIPTTTIVSTAGMLSILRAKLSYIYLIDCFNNQHTLNSAFYFLEADMNEEKRLLISLRTNKSE